MDWVDRINQALGYIEKNLYHEIDYDEIGRIILSPANVLQRFFMLNTGITLTEYIRRRKLSEAAQALKYTDEKVIDIAFQFGYGSSDAFSVAFKRLYGITPMDARLSGAILKPYPRIVFSLSITYLEGDVKVKDIGELVSKNLEEHEIFIMPDARIIGIARRCTFDNDNAGLSPHQEYWDEFFSFRKAIDSLPLIIKDSMVCWTGDSPEGSNYYTYMPGIICPANTPVPDGLDFRDLPASFVAKGVYGDQTNLIDVINNFKQLGFTTCYSALGWNAKLFLGEDEKSRHLNTPCRWLVPCIKIKET